MISTFFVVAAVASTIFLLSIIWTSRDYRKLDERGERFRKRNEQIKQARAKQFHKPENIRKVIGIKEHNFKYVRGNRFGFYFSPETYGQKLLNLSGYSHKRTNK